MIIRFSQSVLHSISIHSGRKNPNSNPLITLSVNMYATIIIRKFIFCRLK